MGEAFVKEVNALIELIGRGRERFQHIEGDLRVGRMKRFPYRIYFRYDAGANHATIFAVMHERRRPDYWQHRLKKGL